MIAFGLTMLGVAVLALVFIGGIKVGAKWFAQPRELAPVIVNFPVPGELQLARALVDGYRAQRAIIAEATVVPPSEFTALPWSVVPSPARTFWVQTLVDDIQDLHAEVDRLRELVAWKDSLRVRYLARWKATQRRLRASVPVESLAVVEDLRTRSLTVAKSASTRAAEMSNAINELDAARFEAITLDEFNTEFEQILVRHQLTGATV